MSIFAGGSGIGVAAGIGAAVIVGGVVWYQATRDVPAPQSAVAVVAPQESPAAQAPAEEAVVEAAVAPVETPEAQVQATEETAAVSEVAAVPAPRFDEVRRETDGMTVIAGAGAPGAEITVLLDGEDLAQLQADQSGQFATLLMIAPDGEGHILSLRQVLGDSDIVSADQIILAPLNPPVALATTEAPEALQTATAEPVQTATAEAEPSDTTAAPAAETPAAETQEVAVLKSSDAGVELLNTTPPEVMDNVAIDTISYSEEGDVQLAGRAQTEARRVQVYLDNAAIVSLEVDAEGRWRGDLPNVDEGIYTLRVDEVSEDGTVTSRVETPFQREDPEVLAEASAGQEGPLRRITVQRGSTLWAIAQDRYGDPLLYVSVFEANQDSIRDPDLIYPGQVFDLPEN